MALSTEPFNSSVDFGFTQRWMHGTSAGALTLLLSNTHRHIDIGHSTSKDVSGIDRDTHTHACMYAHIHTHPHTPIHTHTYTQGK